MYRWIKELWMEIRIATIEDAEALLGIYAPYVTDTAVSFEYEVPSVSEFKNRISKTLIEYPYLIAIEDNQIVGYAYASAFHPREAYKHCAELSVYIMSEYKGRGIGKKLYEKLEEILLKQNVFMVHACIASPDETDEYLTADSEKFHEKMGFELSARHNKCGYKFGRWYSVIWMDKVIGDKVDNPEKFIPFELIKKRTHAKD